MALLPAAQKIAEYGSIQIKDKVRDRLAYPSSSLRRLRNTSTQVKNMFRPTSPLNEENREELIKLRKDLLRTFSEAQNTEKILMQNTKSLKKAASSGDESAVAILDYLDDTKKTKLTEALFVFVLFNSINNFSNDESVSESIGIKGSRRASLLIPSRFSL